MNLLEQLRCHTTVVADTGDFELIRQYRPTDATTNPSLILKAAQMPQYEPIVRDAIAKANKGATASTEDICDQLFVDFGVEILKSVSGRVSTEISADLSFHRQESITRAEKIIELYEQAGIPKERILIKLAATWEGIKAAEALEKKGIHCNLTLLFSMPQAVACADAGVTLISPFVGRITDWFKKLDGVDSYAVQDDPGIRSVVNIYNYYKKFGYNTEVMAASFRSPEQVTALAGCDLLTIAPAILEQLNTTEGCLDVNLTEDNANASDAIHMPELGEAPFRWQLNANAMATEKLAEGIRLFSEDQAKLEQFIHTLT